MQKQKGQTSVARYGTLHDSNIANFAFCAFPFCRFSVTPRNFDIEERNVKQTGSVRESGTEHVTALNYGRFAVRIFPIGTDTIVEG